MVVFFLREYPSQRVYVSVFPVGSVRPYLESHLRCLLIYSGALTLIDTLCLA